MADQPVIAVAVSHAQTALVTAVLRWLALTLLSLWTVIGACFVQAAERVVSLAPSLTEMMADLGAGEQLVGRLEDGRTDLPLREVPVLGLAGRLDMERLLAAEPDWVLYWPGSIDSRQLRQLEQQGIRVFHAAARTLPEMIDQYRQLGRVLGVEERAESLTDELEERLQTLRETYAERQQLRVFYQLWDKPMYTLGGSQIVSDALSYCGATNIFSDLELPAPQVNLEMVLARQPDLVLLTRSELQDSWPQGLRLPALEVPDDGLDRPSAQMLTALELLCEALDSFR